MCTARKLPLLFPFPLLYKKGIRSRYILVKHCIKYTGSGRDFSKKTESHDCNLTLAQCICLNATLHTFAFSAFFYLFAWDF